MVAIGNIADFGLHQAGLAEVEGQQGVGRYICFLIYFHQFIGIGFDHFPSVAAAAVGDFVEIIQKLAAGLDIFGIEGDNLVPTSDRLVPCGRVIRRVFHIDIDIVNFVQFRPVEEDFDHRIIVFIAGGALIRFSIRFFGDSELFLLDALLGVLPIGIPRLERISFLKPKESGNTQYDRQK